ncbi:hypothetical protein SNE40_020711 [Patella caerulea]|uniref:Uncharacterized protein n=1 Tax=Patella caerulea TaxID=87958 RepID=A0AAN8J5L9_PATCE
MFSRARAIAPLLRKKEQQYELNISLLRREKIKNVKLKKEEKDNKNKNEMLRIEKNIRQVGGIVKSEKDLDSLLNTVKSLKNKKEKVRDQLLYAKYFLSKDIARNQLCMSRTLKELRQNLFEVLNLNIVPEFCTGMFVAVAYEDIWYPGEILNVLDETREITFLHPKRKGGMSYIWPQVKDIQRVDKKFIFFRDLSVEPTPGLRFWIVHEFDDIQDSFLEYCRQFFSE